MYLVGQDGTLVQKFRRDKSVARNTFFLIFIILIGNEREGEGNRNRSDSSYLGEGGGQTRVLASPFRVDSHLDVNARDEFRHPGNTKLCRQVCSVLERNIRENVVLIMSSIGASKLKLHVSTTFPETRTTTTLRQLSSHLSQISPLHCIHIFSSSVSGESNHLLFRLFLVERKREKVSKFHLYLCDETRKRKRYPFIGSVKNRRRGNESETADKIH